MPLVELVDIGMTYGMKTPAPVVALRGISCCFERGVNYAITGASGSGKSTMLNIIAGLLTPTAGEVQVNGKSMAGLKDGQRCAVRNQHIGMVVQDFALLEYCTVEENCVAPAIIAGKRLSEARKRARELFARVGLAEVAGQKARYLSGGQRQRVAVARAMMNQPELLLADEPTGALDSVNAQRVLSLLLGERERGATLILVTHNPEFAALCDRQVVLVDGEIVEAARSL